MLQDLAAQVRLGKLYLVSWALTVAPFHAEANHRCINAATQPYQTHELASFKEALGKATTSFKTSKQIFTMETHPTAPQY
jgi:hypothetical protein